MAQDAYVQCFQSVMSPFAAWSMSSPSMPAIRCASVNCGRAGPWRINGQGKVKECRGVRVVAVFLG